MSKMRHILEGQLSKISIKLYKRRVKPSYKHCFDCPGAQKIIRNLLNKCGLKTETRITHKIDSFLKRMAKGDEKWKRLWSNRSEPKHIVAKPETTVRRRLMCVWWYWQEIIYYELLHCGKTFSLVLYDQQLNRLKETIAQKLGWEIFMHPPCGSNLASRLTFCCCLR